MIGQRERPAAPNEIWMQRVFDAPRDLVYRMWTEPDRVEWWWGLTQTLTRLAAGTGDRLMNIRDDIPTIVMVREFAAPRELVFKAHIDPEMMREWWAPYRLSNESVELDGQPGGTWLVMQRSGDVRHRFSGEYKEVVPPERIVSTFVWGGEPDLVAQVTTTFEDLGNGRTRLTSTTTLPSVAARNAWMEHGAIGGGLQVYERLESLLSRQTRSTWAR